MTTDKLSFLLLLILAMQISYFAISGIVLFVRNHEQHDRSRLIFALVCLSFTLGAISFIASALMFHSITEFFHYVLELYPTIFVLPVFLLLPAYVLEVLRPKWLNLQRILLFLSPWLVTCLTFFSWYVVQGWTYNTITSIHSWNELGNFIHQPDVIFRLIFLSYYIFYALGVFFIPYDSQRSNVSIRWKWTLQCMVLLVAVGFVVGVQLRVTSMMIFYWVIVDTMIGVVLYLELRVRIPVPEKLLQVETQPSSAYVAHSVPLSDLAQNLQALLDQGVWKNPEVCRDDLCTALQTNRTYFSAAIHELGYDNYADMINLRRMHYVRQQLDKFPDASVFDLLFQAGYRNSSSAVRYFTIHFGVSPLKYTHQS